MMDRPLYVVPDTVPLIGCIAFGLIDRGTNLIQVRPISTCPLSCRFCSTNAGPKTTIRQTEYVVPLDILIEEFGRLAAFKGRHNLEAHVDTVGDPVTYPHIDELVSQLSATEGVETVSMQTHASTLTAKLLDKLSNAGLTRLNLSLDSLEPELAKELSNTEWYDPEKVVKLAEHVISSTKIDLLIAPVWINGVNDAEIPKITQLAIDLGAGKKFPPMGIQRCERHKHGRKIKKAKWLSWGAFYKQLSEWEKQFNIKLILTETDFNIHQRKALTIPYQRFQKIKIEVVGPGWLKNERLAVTRERGRCLTLINAREIPEGAKLTARILANKHNILIAEPT